MSTQKPQLTLSAVGTPQTCLGFQLPLLQTLAAEGKGPPGGVLTAVSRLNRLHAQLRAELIGAASAQLPQVNWR